VIGQEDKMMPNGWHDGAWGFVWMTISWVAIVALVWMLIRAFTPRGDGPERLRDPRDILADRFAKGEIDAAEYRERLDVLNERARPASGR
jgi:putative membrane protein